VREELNTRLHPRDELEFLLSIQSNQDPDDQDPLYDEENVKQMIGKAQRKLVDMLGRQGMQGSVLSSRLARLKAVDVEELPALLEVAERFEREFVPDGFVGYDEARAAYELAIAEGREAEASDDAWGMWDGDVEEYVTLKKAIAAVRSHDARTPSSRDPLACALSVRLL